MTATITDCPSDRCALRFLDYIPLIAVEIRGQAYAFVVAFLRKALRRALSLLQDNSVTFARFQVSAWSIYLQALIMGKSPYGHMFPRIIYHILSIILEMGKIL